MNPAVYPAGEPPPPYSPYPVQPGQAFVAQPQGPLGWNPSAPPQPFLAENQGYYPNNQGLQQPPMSQSGPYYNQGNPQNVSGGANPLQTCCDTFCCCLAGYCIGKMVTDLLCCVCNILGDG